jgi:hypothetical protein
MTPEDRMQMLSELADYTADFDAIYGTKLMDAMIDNGFTQP